MSTISFDFEAKDDAVQKALVGQQREIAKLLTKVAELQASTKAGAKEANEWAKARDRAAKSSADELARLGAAADKIKEQIRTPFQTAQVETAKLREHLQAGRLSTDEYRAALARVARELKEQTRDHKAETAAQAAATAEDREAARVLDATRTKSERYAIAVDRLNKLREKGKIDGQAHARAIEAEARKLKDGESAAGGFSSALGPISGQLTTMVAGFVSLSAVIAAIREEYDRLIDRQNKAALAQVGLAAAQEQAAFNLGEDPQLNAERLFATIRKQSQDLGMNERDLTMAVSDALSARGDASAGKAVESVVAAAKLRRFKPDELPGLSASALDISKGTGLGLEESLGFLLQTGTLSRVTDMGKLSKNVAPAIVGGMQFGASREFAGGVTAALSQGIVDPTGETSRTATTQLFNQMREFGKSGFVGGAAREEQAARIEEDFKRRKAEISASKAGPGIDKFLQIEELKKQKAHALEALSKSTPEMGVEQVFKRLQTDEKFKADFFRPKSEGGFAASFEAKALPAVEALLQRGSAVNNQFANAFTSLKTQDPGQRFARTVAERDALPAAQVAIAEQQFKNTTDQLRLSDPKQAMSGVIRAGLEDVRSTLGNNGVGTRLTGILDDARSGGVQSLPKAITALRSEQAAVKFGGQKAIPSFGAVSNDVTAKILTEQETKTIALLDRMVGQLEKLNAATAQQGQQKQQAGQVAGRAAAAAAREGGR